jgi:hypothetical protein
VIRAGCPAAGPVPKSEGPPSPVGFSLVAVAVSVKRFYPSGHVIRLAPTRGGGGGISLAWDLPLQGGHVFLEELFELFGGKHLVDDLEDGLLVLLVEQLDQAHLFDGGFVFHPSWRKVLS